jgi:hypothetical protein
MREAWLRLQITKFTPAPWVGCPESQHTKIKTGRIEPAQWHKEAITRELHIHSRETGA